MCKEVECMEGILCVDSRALAKLEFCSPLVGSVGVGDLVANSCGENH